MIKLVIIIGPTATGKTKLGVDLAKKYNGEIISADSRQVYKGMDIVTGKDKGEYGDVLVWGIDLVDPDYNFNVSDFVNFADVKILDIVSRNKLPIIVGGTALYIKALLEPLETIHIKPNPNLRKELENLSVEKLQLRLGKNNLNPSDIKNPRRLIRAIEVKETAKEFESSRPTYEPTIISLVAPQGFIAEKISSRVDTRIRSGAKEELKSLLDLGYSLDLPSMTALGYKDIDDPDLWQLHERQYAKRQIQFISKFIKEQKEKDIRVIELDVTNEIKKNSLRLKP